MIKSIITGCAVLTLSALAVTHAEFSYEQELQQGCNKVKQYASSVSYTHLTLPTILRV